MRRKGDYLESNSRRQLLKAAGVLASVAALPPGLRSQGVAFEKVSPASSLRGNQMLQLPKQAIGIMLPHEQYPVPQLVQFGVAAEQAGFDFVATSDHFQPWQPNEGHSGMAWVTLGALGQRTKRLIMGTTVTCPSYRYSPAVVAEGFASLSLLTPGRIFLGVGSGEALNEEAATGMWDKWPVRSERLVEATQLIRELWKGEAVNHEGQYFKAVGKLYDKPPQTIPLLMAGNGPKAMKRSGQYGDGLITDAKTWKQYKPLFDEGVSASGKNPADVPVLVEQYVVVGGKAEADQAAELWRFGPKAWNPYFDIRDPAVIQTRAEKEIPLEKVTEGWPMSTEPEVHVEVLTKLFDSGVTMVNVHAGQFDQMRVIEFYGKNVIPHFRSAAQRSSAARAR